MVTISKSPKEEGRHFIFPKDLTRGHFDKRSLCINHTVKVRILPPLGHFFEGPTWAHDQSLYQI
jgi:hypothetical protein